jgi:hypothetical protein
MVPARRPLTTGERQDDSTAGERSGREPGSAAPWASHPPRACPRPRAQEHGERPRGRSDAPGPLPSTGSGQRCRRGFGASCSGSPPTERACRPVSVATVDVIDPRSAWSGRAGACGWVARRNGARWPVLGISVGTWTARRRVRRAPLSRIGQVSRTGRVPGRVPGRGGGRAAWSPHRPRSPPTRLRGVGGAPPPSVPCPRAGREPAGPFVQRLARPAGVTTRSDGAGRAGERGVDQTGIADERLGARRSRRSPTVRTSIRTSPVRRHHLTRLARERRAATGPEAAPCRPRPTVGRRVADTTLSGMGSRAAPGPGPGPAPNGVLSRANGPGRLNRPHGTRAHHPLARWRRGRRDPRRSATGRLASSGSDRDVGRMPAWLDVDGIAWRCHALGADSGRLPVVVRLRAPIAPTVPPRSPVAPPTVEERASRSGDRHPPRSGSSELGSTSSLRHVWLAPPPGGLLSRAATRHPRPGCRHRRCRAASWTRAGSTRPALGLTSATHPGLRPTAPADPWRRALRGHPCTFPRRDPRAPRPGGSEREGTPASVPIECGVLRSPDGDLALPSAAWTSRLGPHGS